ncbi:MAG: 30S ribosomal protein S20 [bacterium]|nr:30S ribosomal protein S20 [bacterium]
MAVVHKSTIKRARQNLIRRQRNQRAISRIRTESKKVVKAVEAGDLEAARATLQVTIPFIAKAASKGILHRRTASRKVSRLTKMVNLLEAKPST